MTRREFDKIHRKHTIDGITDEGFLTELKMKVKLTPKQQDRLQGAYQMLEYMFYENIGMNRKEDIYIQVSTQKT